MIGPCPQQGVDRNDNSTTQIWSWEMQVLWVLVVSSYALESDNCLFNLRNSFSPNIYEVCNLNLAPLTAAIVAVLQVVVKCLRGLRLHLIVTNMWPETMFTLQS